MLVPLNSPEGTKRLEEASAESSGDRRGCDNSGDNTNDTTMNINTVCSSAVQQDVIESFRKQRGNTVCGLASLAVLLTARKKSLQTTTTTTTPTTTTTAIPAMPATGENTKKEETSDSNDNDNDNSNDDDCCFVDEDDVYPLVSSTVVMPPIIASNNNNDKVVVSEEDIRTSGMTLDQVRALAEALTTTEKAIAFSPAATMIPVEEHNTNTKDIKNSSNNRQTTTTLLEGPHQLRTLVSNVLSEHPSSKQGLVLNYHMSTLGQVPFGGHLSPIAAYHSRSDSILVMDVWHTHTEPVWASVECVWKAISGIDPSSGLPRGLLKLVHHSS